MELACRLAVAALVRYFCSGQSGSGRPQNAPAEKRDMGVRRLLV
jgi:hypothetical protein